jgi:hypothetical protein
MKFLRQNNLKYFDNKQTNEPHEAVLIFDRMFLSFFFVFVPVTFSLG